METEKEMTAIQKTQVYLENYREIERYIKDAISEVSQIDDVSRYNISAEKAFLQSIRECKAETVILFEHMKKALASLKEDAEAAGEGYKYDALEAVYIKGNASMKATQTQLRSLIDYHFKEAGGYEKVLCDRFLVAPPLFFGENSPRENQDTGE